MPNTSLMRKAITRRELIKGLGFGAGAVALVACGRAPAAPPATPAVKLAAATAAPASAEGIDMKLEEDTLRLIDHMSALARFFEDARELPDDVKLREFRARVIAPNLKYYAMVMGISDGGLRRYIEDIEPRIGAIFSGQERALRRFRDVLARFREKFPQFRVDLEVHVLPSLNLFKGMAVPNGDETILLLGVDGLLELSESQLRGYLTHELFHVYHYQRVPRVRAGAEMFMRTQQMPPLWALLWTEGMASHAVRVVYPEIKEEEVLDWQLLVEQTRPLLPDLADEARRVLRSDLPQDVAGFFYLPRESDRAIPTGCGYYIGMVVAAMLAQNNSIDELLRLDDEVLISGIDSALAKLRG